MKRQQWTAGLTAALACIALVATQGQPAQAQDFGGKPIRMIVGVVAGGATDVTARLIAQKLTDSLGTPVLVENRPGAFFEPAYREVTNAAPDGHTIFMISASTVVTQPGRKDFPYDIRKLVPIAKCRKARSSSHRARASASRSVADLVAYGKKNPGKLSFGSGGGAGSSLSLVGGIAAAARRHHHHQRSVQGRRRRAQRPARQSHRRHVRCAAGRGRTGQERQRHRPGGDQRQALAGAAGRADHDGSPASRIS